MTANTESWLPAVLEQSGKMRIGTTKIASGLLWSSWLWLGVDRTPDNDAIVGRGSRPTETAVAGCGTGRAPYDRVASKPSRAEDAQVLQDVIKRGGTRELLVEDHDDVSCR